METDIYGEDWSISLKITENLFIDKVKGFRQQWWSTASHDILQCLNICNFLARKNQTNGAIYGFNFWRNSSMIASFSHKILMSRMNSNFYISDWVICNLHLEWKHREKIVS